MSFHTKHTIDYKDVFGDKFGNNKDKILHLKTLIIGGSKSHYW